MAHFWLMLTEWPHVFYCHHQLIFPITIKMELSFPKNLPFFQNVPYIRLCAIFMIHWNGVILKHATALANFLFSPSALQSKNHAAQESMDCHGENSGQCLWLKILSAHYGFSVFCNAPFLGTIKAR